MKPIFFFIPLLSNETEEKKSKKNKNTEPMPAYKTRDSSYLIEGTKSEKTTIFKLKKINC